MPPKILVIDDDNVSRKILESRLQANQYEVWSAQNGKEGLQRLERGEIPNLIILDVLMPEMDGFTFLKTVKKDTKLSLTPVIVVTERGKMEDTFRAIGVEHFFTKPFDMEKILNEIAQLTRFVLKAEVAPKAEATHKPGEPPREAAKASGATAASTSSSLTKNVIVFGSHETVLHEISSKLRTDAYQFSVFKDINQMLKQLESLKPKLLLLEVYVNWDFPLDHLIEVIRKKIDRKGATPIPILLFKVDEEMSGGAAQGDNIADIDSLLTRCLSEETKYLGGHSAFSFLYKLKEALC